MDGKTIAYNDTAIGVNLNWGRSLRPDLTSLATLGYAQHTLSQGKTLTANFQLNYAMSERLCATLRYQFLNENSNLVTGTYYRNQVEIGLRRSF